MNDVCAVEKKQYEIEKELRRLKQKIDIVLEQSISLKERLTSVLQPEAIKEDVDSKVEVAPGSPLGAEIRSLDSQMSVMHGIYLDILHRLEV